MINRMTMIINVSSEAILRNSFASVELKDVRGFLVKLHLVSVNWSYIFIV